MTAAHTSDLEPCTAVLAHKAGQCISWASADAHQAVGVQAAAQLAAEAWPAQEVAHTGVPFGLMTQDDGHAISVLLSMGLIPCPMLLQTASQLCSLLVFGNCLAATVLPKARLRLCWRN